MSHAAIEVFRLARPYRDPATGRTVAADDLTGTGAARHGDRWNAIKTPVVYASASRALAALEVLAHLRAPDAPRLPGTFYLVAISIPHALWTPRTVFDPASCLGWDALPYENTSATWGSRWARSSSSAVAEVPSVIIPEERNILLNPRHPDGNRVTATVARPWSYDTRLVSAES